MMNGGLLAVHVKKNLHVYLLVFSVIASGCILGAMQVNRLDSELSKTLYDSISNGFQNKSFDYSVSISKFYASALESLICTVVIWVFGMTVIGVGPIVLYLFFRGAALGFTVGFMFKAFSTKGLLVTLISVLPANIIFLPCIILMSVFGITFSKKLFANRNDDKKSLIFSYSAVMLILLLIMLVGSLIWAFSPFYLVL